LGGLGQRANTGRDGVQGLSEGELGAGIKKQSNGASDSVGYRALLKYFKYVCLAATVALT